LKFWQKTFICTLALFLVCFGSGIFALAVFFNGQLVENCENTCLAEQFYIAKSFAADCEYTSATGGSVSELIMSYSEYYAGDGIILAVEYGGETGDSGSALASIAYSAEFSGEEGERTYFQQRVDGKRYIFIKSGLDKGSITYIKDISYLDDDWRTIALIFVSISIGVSIVLATVLFVMLKRLASPLAKLTAGTAAVAKGDYSVRTEVGGKDEFSELSDGFNYMTEQISDQIAALERAAEQKQQLVDDLSHEMRTPLTSIHGYAEYLLSAAVGEEERIDALLCIMSESERLGNLSQSLLDISYAAGAEITKAEIDAAELVESVERRLDMKAKSLSVELVTETEPMKVSGDATLLELLFTNLADNAVKACRDASEKRVTMRLSAEEGRAVFSVTDTGRGMTEDEILHITEPFYRTDRVRSRADGGAGLGLTLCQRIVEAHGGEMKFFSVPGEGTTVKVYF
jgi:signal transduction histidine kinase